MRSSGAISGSELSAVDAMGEEKVFLPRGARLDVGADNGARLGGFSGRMGVDVREVAEVDGCVLSTKD